MATIDEINALYSQNLNGAKPTGADIDYWTKSGLQGDQLYNTFMNSAKSDPRFKSSGLGATPNAPQTPQTPAFDPNAITGAVGTAMQGLGTQMQGAFDVTNQNLQTGFNATNQNMATGFQGVNTNIQNGFNQTGQQLGTIGSNVTNGFNQTNQNMATGFNSLNQADETRANALGQQATDNFNQLKGYTSGLGGQITDLKGAMTTGFGGVSDQVGDVQSSVDTVGSDLTGLQNDFTRRSNIADQKRAEIMDSVAGTAANNRQAMTQGFNQVGNQIAGLGGQPQGGMPQGGQGGQQPQGNFANALNNARQVLANPQGVNPAVGAQLSEFVSSFDQNGQLIAQGPDAQGVMTFRNMGPDGLLQIAKQTQQGMQFAGAINVNQIVQMFGGQ